MINIGDSNAQLKAETINCEYKHYADIDLTKLTQDVIVFAIRFGASMLIYNKHYELVEQQYDVADYVAMENIETIRKKQKTLNNLCKSNFEEQLDFYSGFKRRKFR